MAVVSFKVVSAISTELKLSLTDAEISGMIALPFNMVSNTPVECTIDPENPLNANLTFFSTVIFVE